ncbi:MAG: hypothetical protein AABX59_02660, partial [Nanoarchaeota archaeon]
MYPFRASSLRERQEFYEKEFNVNSVKRWFKDRRKPQIMEVDVGTETHIAKIKKDINKLVVLNFMEIGFAGLRKELLRILPEDVYYDRNQYARVNEVIKKKNFRTSIGTKNWLGQELAFDIDPENIKCECKKRKVEELYKFCEICLGQAKSEVLNMHEELRKTFKKVEIVYSGRGYHLHVFDKA